MLSKQKQLEELRNKIIDKICKEDWKDVWFYPKYKDIKGYLGTQDIVFIGPNPSYNRFPTRYTDFFYNQLRINGFKNAHLTDLIKIRLFNKDAEIIFKNKNIINKQLSFLSKELDIIKPRLIIVLGKGSKSIIVKETLEKNFTNLNIKVVNHYSSIRFPKNKKKFIQEMRNVKKSI